MLNLVYFDHQYQGLEDLTGLEFALNLRELKTYTTQIVDLSPLKNLTNLTSLELSDNQIADLSPLKNLTELTYLELSNNQIADLSPLKNLTELTYLELSNNQIADLSPLKNLTSLQELQLSDNRIVDILPLGNLTRLKTLTLNQNDISHILPLGNLAGLKTLELKNNLIWDIAPLEPMVRLWGTSISFNTNKVRMPSGEASVDNINIPDPNLRRPIETALGKAENAPISDTDMLKLIRLEQPQAGIRDLIGLEFAINLQVLALQSSKIFDLSPLKDLTNLRTLRLLDNKISDLSPLKDLNNLTELDLFRNQIFDLSPLKNLNNLRELVLTRNGISDLSPITNLTNLTELGLGVNKISDLSSLKNLTNLISLDLFSNQISDISPLKDLTNLETLRLAVNPISDISPLKDLTNLKGLSFTARPGIDASVLEKLREQGMEFLSGTKTSATIYDQRLADAIRRELGGNSATVLNMKNIINLDLSDYGVQNLTGLEFAINLEVLNLENSQISSISPLKNLTKLRELNLGKNTTNYFHKNKISDISPLENLTNLTSLVLENNKVSDISSLKNLTKLSELNLNDNQIANVSSLRNLTNLTQLGLSGNQVADISTLRNLTNLTQLGLAGNQVADISTLRNLTNLTQLGLAGNQVADISTLRYLTNLTQLGLSGNQVADISTLRNLTNLTQLGLSGNQVADISTLRNLTNLTQLDLSGNQVADISTLRNLTNLTQLGLAGNQIANVSLLRYLTNLTQLDLGFNKIADVSTLRYLTKLTYLNLENNQITDLPQFENLTKLDTLILWNNYIYGARLSKRTRVWLLSLENLKYHLHLLEPSCDTTIPNFLEPLERVGVELQLEERQISTDGGDITVSTVKGAISQGKGPAWTLDETVFNDSTFLVLTVQLLGTDGAKRDNLDYLVGDKKKYNAAARVNPPSGMKELIEDVVYDWAETANIEFWFVDGSERDADIRIAFYDAEKLDPKKPENRRTSVQESRVGSYESDQFEPTMWISVERNADYSPGTEEAKARRGTLLHEFGHAFGFMHEHLSSKFLEVFEWDFDFDKAKEEDREFMQSYEGYPEIRKHKPGTKNWSNGEIYNNFLKIRMADEASEIDTESIMAYSIPAILLKAKDSADPSEKKLVDEIDETTGMPRVANESPQGIQGQREGLSWGDRDFIETIYTERTPKAQITGNVKLKGKDYSTTSVDFTRVYGSLSKFHTTPLPQFAAAWNAGFFNQDKIRVEIYLSTEKIVKGKHIRMGATALFFHGGGLENAASTRDLDDVACKSFEVPLDGTSKKVVLKLENANAIFEARNVKQCTELGFKTNRRGGWGLYGDLIPLGTQAWATVTLNLQAESVPAGSRVLFSVPNAPSAASIRGNVVSLESDVNGDGQVNTADLMLVSEYLGQLAPEMPPVDINNDGTVTIADLVQVAQHLHLSPIRAAPALSGASSGLTYETVEAWIDTARAENDGSLVFRQGIANLEALLLLLVPAETVLLANYPNPFNPETWIPYHLAAPAKVALTIYAVDGKVVRHLDLGHQVAGFYQSKSRAAYWDGRNNVGERVASGIYFYTLTTGDFRATKKMLIIK